MGCPIHRVPYTVSHTLCPIHCVPYTVSHTLCPIHCVSHTVSHTLCPTHCVPCTVSTIITPAPPLFPILSSFLNISTISGGLSVLSNISRDTTLRNVFLPGECLPP